MLGTPNTVKNILSKGSINEAVLMNCGIILMSPARAKENYNHVIIFELQNFSREITQPAVTLK
jgi:hypothetical protein